jgi:hypothetical protein
MKKMMTLVALLMASLCYAEQEELIYQPKVLMPEIPDAAKVDDRNWRLSGYLGQVLPSNLDSSDQIGGSLSYLVANRWYITTELWYSKWAGQQIETTEAFRAGAGLGFDFLQGAAYVAKGLTLPWTMYGQLSSGSHYMDDDSATYYTGALGWRLANDNYYAGLEWQAFNIDDRRLQQINSDKGYQWAIQLGRYF